jgi:hypothetical protein
VLHPARVERRPPAALLVPRELEVETLARHAGGDETHTATGVEPSVQSVESRMRSVQSTNPLPFTTNHRKRSAQHLSLRLSSLSVDSSPEGDRLNPNTGSPKENV